MMTHAVESTWSAENWEHMVSTDRDRTKLNILNVRIGHKWKKENLTSRTSKLIELYKSFECWPAVYFVGEVTTWLPQGCTENNTLVQLIMKQNAVLFIFRFVWTTSLGKQFPLKQKECISFGPCPVPYPLAITIKQTRGEMTLDKTCQAQPSY